MEKKHKAYFKLNLMSLFFAGVSFISVTLAWFAYSGLATSSTEINVKAWHIEFSNNDDLVSSSIVISLDDISPGMETVSEIIKIKNLGDSAATLSYKIKSVRILDDEIEVDGEEGYVEDVLAHEYPFHINMGLIDSYVNANDGISEFQVSVSWPLDSDNDSVDSEWGNKAYEFNASEKAKLDKDSSYQVRSSIKIEISLEAAQYIDDSSASDPNYRLGDIVLYNFEANEKCSEISSSCIKTYVIDKDSKLSDTSVTLLPDLYGDYVTVTASEYDSALSELTSSWSVTSRGLKAEDILTIISKDVINSILVKPNLSDEIIGYLDYGNRMDDYLEKTISYKGYYKFLNDGFGYFTTNKCYWLDTEYDDDYQFALQKVDDEYSKVYNEEKSATCSVVPVVIVSKAKLDS